MPVETRDSAAGRFDEFVITGSFEPAEIVAAMKVFLSRDDLGDGPSFQLWDATAVDFSNLTLDRVQALADGTAQLASIMRPGRTALLVAGAFERHVFDMYDKMRTTGAIREFRVFGDRELALEFLAEPD